MMVRGPEQRPPALRFLLHVVPGLEDLAIEEAAEVMPEARVAGVWKGFDERTSIVEMRASRSERAWMALRLPEDIYLLAGRARGIQRTQQGLHELAAATLTSKYLDTALQTWTSLTGRQPKTFRVVARKSGEHTFRRVDAQQAVEGALRSRLPRSRLVEDDADAEFWLSIIGQIGLLGLRVTSAQRRRTGQAGADPARPVRAATPDQSRLASLPAALKPSVARAMVRLSEPRPEDIVLDPFAGTGTLLFERGVAGPAARLMGSDRDEHAVRALRRNARALHLSVEAQVWDALELPLEDGSVHAVLTNPPFGKRVALPKGDAGQFYRRAVREISRVLRPGGRLVLVTNQFAAMSEAIQRTGGALRLRRRIRVLLRGEPATIFVCMKSAAATLDARPA